MNWSYNFRKLETFGRFNEEYLTECGFLFCAKSGGIFKAGEIYPYYSRAGYPHIVIINIMTHEAKTFNLDAYSDDTYRIVAAIEDGYENAIFREVMI